MTPPKQPPEHYLLTLLQQTTDQERLAAILGALLSPKEQQELYKRLQIFALLQQGTTQRDISTTVGVSLVTVSRGAKATNSTTSISSYPISAKNFLIPTSNII
ncbi:Trp family transcriptional regulator [Rappaport israeli]|uniref:Trp family transcriptional regulator n=1 Tax=Rappaport israeli TaxID=1839807 RepID=UPI000930511D